ALLPPEICIPAVGQGALCIECREGDADVLELLTKLQHEPTALAVQAERRFLRILNGGCQVPLGAFARIEEPDGAGAPRLTLTAVVGSPDGRQLIKETCTGTSPEALGLEAAEKLLARGADRILAAARE